MATAAAVEVRRVDGLFDFDFINLIFLLCSYIATILHGWLVLISSLAARFVLAGLNLSLKLKSWVRRKIVYNRNIIRSVRCWINKCVHSCHASVKSSLLLAFIFFLSVFWLQLLQTINSMLDINSSSFFFSLISIQCTLANTQNNCLSLN